MIAFFRRRFRRRPDAIVCRDAVALMAGYLDGALAERDRARLEDHLAACPHCSEHLAQLQVTIDTIGRVDVVDELPDDAVDDLVAVYRRWIAD
jgi:anti-sigma factor RsiW